MVRPPLLILQLLSMLLFIGIAIAWGSSYWTTRGFVYRVTGIRDGATHEREAALWWGRGRFVLSRHSAVSYRGPSLPPGRTRQWFVAPVTDPATIVANYAITKSVLGIRRIDDTSASGGDWLIVPAGWLLLITLPGPYFLFRSIRRRIVRAARRRKGLCLECGYDLRAASGRCPECGTEPALNRAPQPVAGQSV